MTVLLFIVGVVAFVVGIGVSIALHELGHLIPAKAFGVKVTQYMIGFGPTLWSRRRGETEYGIKAIPLGGYNRMLGMFAPQRGQDPNKVRATSTGRLGIMVDEACRLSLEEIKPGDHARVFYKLSSPKKIVIMLGGPVMNLIIAAVILGAVTVGFGTQQPNTTIQTVAKCVQPASAPANETCTTKDPRTPAAKAGLQPGDTVAAVDGVTTKSWSQLQSRIRAHPGTPLTVTVRRHGQTKTVSIDPIRSQQAKLDANGDPVVGADGKVETVPVGFVGISPAFANVPQPLSSVPGVVGTNVERTAGVFLKLPQKMVSVAQAAFGSGKRDPNGAIGIVGVGRLAGDVASSKSLGATVGDRAVTLLGLVASLNMALFVFNLIPLLPLDGGHVIGALWDGLKRTWARVRGRPRPHYADIAKMLPIAYGVSMVLIVMTGLLAYADLVNPVKLPG